MSETATPIALNLAADGEGKMVPMGLAGLPTEADGVPIHYRKVKLAPCKEWTHRATGEKFNITRERADEWIRNTKALSAAGVVPFLPGEHRETFNAKDNFGFLVDLAREGDDLYGVLALYGDDARKAAAVNSRSIYVVRDAMDANGKIYPGESLAHVAIVPNPALPDLGGTMQIAAASGGAKPVKVFELAVGSLGDEGHFVTIEGNAVFIKDSAGIVPARVRADAKDNRVSKAAIQRRLIQHHHDVGGKGEYTAQDERDLNNAAGAGDPFTFKDKLPTEIKEFMAGRPELRSMFKVTSEAGKAGGADAFGSMGDRYLAIAEAKAGSPLKAAVATAHGSNDPEMQFLAHVHDNMPDNPAALKAQATKLESAKWQNAQAAKLKSEGKESQIPKMRERAARDAADLRERASQATGQETIQAGGLRVGDEFKVNGEKFRVAEDENGYRVLRSHEYEAPVDALNKIPVDKGTFQRAKGGGSTRRKYADAVPFSAGGYRSHAARVLSLNCGTGAGGFKGGNTCAKGGGDTPTPSQRPLHQMTREQFSAYAKKNLPQFKGKHPSDIAVVNAYKQMQRDAVRAGKDVPDELLTSEARDLKSLMQRQAIPGRVPDGLTKEMVVASHAVGGPLRAGLVNESKDQEAIYQKFPELRGQQSSEAGREAAIGSKFTNSETGQTVTVVGYHASGISDVSPIVKTESGKTLLMDQTEMRLHYKPAGFKRIPVASLSAFRSHAAKLLNLIG